MQNRPGQGAPSQAGLLEDTTHVRPTRQRKHQGHGDTVITVDWQLVRRVSTIVSVNTRRRCLLGAGCGGYVALVSWITQR